MTDPKRALCWDKNWRYVPSGSTDVAALFKRIRKAQKEAAEKPPENVKAIKPRKAA